MMCGHRASDVEDVSVLSIGLLSANALAQCVCRLYGGQQSPLLSRVGGRHLLAGGRLTEGCLDADGGGGRGVAQALRN